MARGVLEVDEYRNGQSGSDTQIVEQYIVTTTDAEVSVYEVCRPEHDERDPDLPAVVGTPLPKINDSHRDSPLFRVLPGGITAVRNLDNAKKWIVTVVYTATAMLLDDISDFKIGSRSENIVADAAYEYIAPTGDFENSDTAFLPFINSSNELYDPVNTQTEEDYTIIQFVKREEIGFDPQLAIDFQNSLNSVKVEILGFEFERHQGKINQLTPEPRVDEDGKIRWYTFYEIERAPNGKTHRLKLQNQGFYAKFSGKVREILLSDINPDIKRKSQEDKPVTKPQLLDTDGTLLDDPANTNFWEYRHIKERDWSTGLDIPADAIDLGAYSEDQS